VKLLVYLRDGRTVYLLEKRGRLRQLVGDEPWHEGPHVFAVRGIWNPNTGEYVWTPVYLRHISKSSISVVEFARGIHDARYVDLLAQEPVAA
jgi:hypothetical protein